MTVTLRVQYKGDAARKLLLEQRPEDDQRQNPPKYLTDVVRALGLFQIPAPDHTRSIYKSGFIICSYDTTPESRLYESIYRGARRAQSVACRNTLDGLSISYIHMFENGKPVFFGSRNSHPYHEDQGFRSRGAAPYHPRRKSLSPVGTHANEGRALHAERTWPSVVTSDSTKLPALSADRTSASQIKCEESPRLPNAATPLQKASSSSSDLGLAQTTLNILSKSETLQALLHPSTPSVDRPQKQEEMSFRAFPGHTFLHRSNEQTDASAPKSTEFPNHPPTSIISRGPLASYQQSAYPSDKDITMVSTNSISRTDSRASDVVIPKSQSLYSLGSSEQTYMRPVGGAAKSTASWRRSHSPSSTFPNQEPQKSAELVGQHRAQYRSRSPSSSAPKGISRFSQRRFSLNRYDEPSRERPRSMSPSSRNGTGTRDHAVALDRRPSWTPLGKRPLSPGSKPGGRRSSSPPYKRRFSDRTMDGTSRQIVPYGKPDGSFLSHTQTPTKPRSPRPSLLPARLETATRNPNLLTSNGLMRPPQKSVISNAGANTTPENLSPQKPNTQTINLNRELWDVRRQITALKAREFSLLDELKHMRAPELAQNAVIPKTSTPEEKMKIMEAEIVSLRERLQRETVRRKLVEDSCESERRRRKHAEDMLDDARRETQTPLILPAMMDAFSKIAQLTGDALTPNDE